MPGIDPPIDPEVPANQGAIHGVSSLSGKGTVFVFGHGSIIASSALSGTLSVIQLGQGSIAGSSSISATGGQIKTGVGRILGNSALAGAPTGGSASTDYLDVVWERHLGIIVRRA